MNDSKVPNWLMNASDRIIEHMYDDHSNSITSALNAQHGIKDKNAKMEELQVNGYFVLSNQKLFFLKFERVCYSVDEYRQNLLSMPKNIEVMNYNFF